VNGYTLDSAGAGWSDAHVPEVFDEDAGWFGSKIAHAVGGAIGGAFGGGGPFGLAARLAQRAAAPVAKAASSVAHAVPVVNQAVHVAETAAQAANRIAHGGNVLRTLGSAAHDVAPYVAAASSLVPGIGTLGAAAVQGAAALAAGRPITEATIAAARGAIPGGPLAQSAFDAGLSVVRGGNVTAAAMAAARANLPGGAAARYAFDNAVKLATGQKIQLSRGALPAMLSQAAPSLPMPGFTMPTGVLARPLDTSARRVADALLRRPSLRRLSPAMLARQLGAAPDAAHRAIASVTHATRTIGQFSPGRLPALLAVPYSAADARGLDEALADAGCAAPFAASPDAGAVDPAGPGEQVYTIKSGDTLSAIAKRFPPATVSSLAARNGIADPNKIFAGKTLIVPAPATVTPPATPPTTTPPQVTPPTSPGATYTVKSGDTGSAVANRFTGNANRWRELPAVNPGMRIVNIPDPSNPDQIAYQDLYPWRVGQVVNLPPSWTSSTPAQPPPPVPPTPIAPPNSAALPPSPPGLTAAAWGAAWGAAPVGFVWQDQAGAWWQKTGPSTWTRATAPVAPPVPPPPVAPPVAPPQTTPPQVTPTSPGAQIVDGQIGPPAPGFLDLGTWAAMWATLPAGALYHASLDHGWIEKLGALRYAQSTTPDGPWPMPPVNVPVAPPGDQPPAPPEDKKGGGSLAPLALAAAAALALS